MLQALCALHIQGFVHRNVKAENVLVESLDPKQGPRVKLGGFGFAMKKEISETRNKVVGTRLYMAPELI